LENAEVHTKTRVSEVDDPHFLLKLCTVLAIFP